MALCLFRCISILGCRDCIVNKFAFYPPPFGYRLQETTDFKFSSKEKKETKASTTERPKNLRFTQIPSFDGKNYQLILVYEENEINTSRISSLQPNDSKPNFRSIRIRSSQIKEGTSIKNPDQIIEDNGKRDKNSLISNKNEEVFSQVEDLNLICFKRKTNQENIISGYHIEYTKRKSDVLIIYSHGNSTDIGYVINQALDMAYNLRVNLIAYDYSGYGTSTGSPSEKSCIYDIESIYNLARELGYTPVNIIIYGQSVGSGPSTVLASQAKFPIGGLILHSAFASGLRIVTEPQKKLSKRLNAKDFFPNCQYIQKVNAPIMIIHGCDDADINLHHSNENYIKAKKNYTPFLLQIEGAGHNDIEHDENFRKSYFLKLRDFVQFLRKNRNKKHETHKQMKNLSNQKSGSKIAHSDNTQFEIKDQNNLEGKSLEPWQQGFAGDEWGQTLDHFYKKYLSPIKKSIDQDQKNFQKQEKIQNSFNSFAFETAQQQTIEQKNQEVNSITNQQQQHQLDQSDYSQKLENEENTTSKRQFLQNIIKGSLAQTHENQDPLQKDSPSQNNNLSIKIEQPNHSIDQNQNIPKVNSSKNNHSKNSPPDISSLNNLDCESPTKTNLNSSQNQIISNFKEEQDEEEECSRNIIEGDQPRIQKRIQDFYESLSDVEQQYYEVEEDEENNEEIRQHNATSIPRKKNNSYYKAYIFDSVEQNDMTDYHNSNHLPKSLNSQKSSSQQQQQQQQQKQQQKNQTSTTNNAPKAKKKEATAQSKQMHSNSCKVETITREEEFPESNFQNKSLNNQNTIKGKDTPHHSNESYAEGFMSSLEYSHQLETQLIKGQTH